MGEDEVDIEISAELRKWLDKSAKQAGWSIEDEIEYRLEQSLAAEPARKIN